MRYTLILLLLIYGCKTKKHIKIDEAYSSIADSAYTHPSYDSLPHGFRIKDSNDAIKIALIDWKKEFGNNIGYTKPITAKLSKDSIWNVSTSDQHIFITKTDTVITFGGVLSINIRNSDAKVLYMYSQK